MYSVHTGYLLLLFKLFDDSALKQISRILATSLQHFEIIHIL